MKGWISGLLPFLICLILNQPGNSQSPQNKPTDEAFVADYYYKAKWGYADEFITLFKKNHFPVLKKQIETGRILSVTAAKPRYHATEDGRWDYRVTIVFKNMELRYGSAAALICSPRPSAVAHSSRCTSGRFKAAKPSTSCPARIL